MAEPSGKKTKGSGAGKRPAPTIEGKATVISVEPAGPAAPDTGSKPGDGDERQASPGKAEAKRDEFTPPPLSPRAKGLETIATHLAAGVLGGVAGGIALALLWSNLTPGVEDATPKIDAVEERLAELEGATKAPELAGLTDRVAKTETTLKTMAEAAKVGAVADTAAIGRRLTETEQKLDTKIDAVLAEMGDANASTVQALQDQIADLRTKLAALVEAGLSAEQAELEPKIERLNARLAKLETAIPGIADIIGKETAEAKSATMIIAFANLRAAVSDGRPFAAELDTLKALSPGADQGMLAEHAKTGIPTLPELAKRFAAAKDEALQAAAPVSDGSFLDTLLGSARSLITIRRVDANATGDAPNAVLARAEAELGKGNLAESVKQVETLSGAPRAAFSLWLDQARARLGSEGELKKLESRLLAQVGAASAAKKRTE